MSQFSVHVERVSQQGVNLRLTLMRSGPTIQYDICAHIDGGLSITTHSPRVEQTDPHSVVVWAFDCPGERARRGKLPTDVGLTEKEQHR